MNVTSSRPEIHYQGGTLPSFDAVIPRIGASSAYYTTAVLNQFETMNVYCLNPVASISRARDKLQALQLLARKGIGVPVTGFAHAPDDTIDLIGIAGSPPLIIKRLDSTHGNGVMLADSETKAVELIEHLRGLDINFLVQEFIAEADGGDLRCFVVGGKVVAAMKRQARRGEFRSNLHRGGSAQRVELSGAERETATAAAAVIGLNVAGVDILRSRRGPLVMEVNASPGLEGIEKTTAIDVADLIVTFVERNARRGKRRGP